MSRPSSAGVRGNGRARGRARRGLFTASRCPFAVISSSLILLVLAVVAPLVQAAPGWDCEKYKVQEFELNSKCDNLNSLISVDPGYIVELSPTCEVKATGCVAIRRDFSTAKMSVLLQHGGLRIERNLDGCQLMKKPNENGKLLMEAYGLENGCPVKAERICMNKVTIWDLKRFSKNMESIVGPTIVAMKMSHENSAVSCLHAVIDIRRRI